MMSTNKVDEPEENSAAHCGPTGKGKGRSLPSRMSLKAGLAGRELTVIVIYLES